MNRCPQHTFQILTKRPEVAAEYSPVLNWTPNIWMGTSVENAEVIGRVAALRRTGAAVRFISAEPLLGPIPHLPLRDIDWVIPDSAICPSIFSESTRFLTQPSETKPTTGGSVALLRPAWSARFLLRFRMRNPWPDSCRTAKQRTPHCLRGAP